MNTKGKIEGSRHVLAVKDISQAAAYYTTMLGFKSLWAGGGWHFLTRDGVKIMLGECPDAPSANEIGDHSYFAYFEVEGIDALYDEFKRNGVNIATDLGNREWGQREFSIRTIDGHRITFGEEIH